MGLRSGAAAFFLAVFLFGMGACEVTVVSDEVTVVSDDATITIDNDSLVVLIEVNVAPVGTVSWGRDLLEGQDLFPGESITVVVPCDFYDVRLIDEFGFECIVFDLDLCANDVTLFANFDCDL